MRIKLKLIGLLLLTLLVGHTSTASVDSMMVVGSQLYMHQFKSDQPTTDLIIFLHGSVRAYQTMEQPRLVDEATLLEGNKYFLPFCQENRFDVILPIAFNQFNWLDSNGRDWMVDLAKKLSPTYQRIIIAGFSDGGTGAYNLFYNHLDLFSGLIVFNGYPQHSNQHREVDYQRNTTKPVLFYATKKDRRIPREFLMTEYLKQAMINPRTQFVLQEGSHSFKEYSRSDFTCIRLILDDHVMRPSSPSHEFMVVFPSTPGTAYPCLDQDLKFRGKIGKRYGMPSASIQQIKTTYKTIRRLKQGHTTVCFEPILLPRKMVSSSTTLSVTCKQDEEEVPITLPNWLSLPLW
ncbi:MAG: dienelactone hydrolase family protein [Flavobacteriales bacterium]|nr:dienelactone hydrolase family protein [Bacteroidota bacterium]MCB9241898.1 dienelactone hydrolase family protein [Flavobacteriales bacterium]